MNQVLICQHDGHTWARNASRGRKPKFCPEHKPQGSAEVTVEDATTETLVCQHDGHTWNRTKTRGRKPPFCPQHRVVVAQSTPDGEAEGTGTEGVKVSLPKVILTDSVQKVLDGPMTELKRKLTFTVDELTHPERGAWREHADWMLLIETHRRLKLEADKAIRPRVTVVEEF